MPKQLNLVFIPI